jgi:uncharacterized protein (DUF2235 family)
VPKTIVLCCDGTGNTDTGTPSNVKQLHDLLLCDPRRQISTYHRGVGTEPRRHGESWLRYQHGHLASLCFGEGVAQALVELYATLVAQFEGGDRVCLLGFSRGAFTVRALAGMIHVCGLVRREHAGRAADAIRLYEGSESRIIEERRRQRLPPEFASSDTDHGALDPLAREFKAAYCQPCSIAFLGLWDTVKAYGWLSPRSFPALRHNPGVGTVRHAPSLDERRALFQMTGWASNHPDTLEVWFAGDHSDVGGGHADGNSPLADASLVWMLGEATHAGLRLDPAKKGVVECLQAGAADAPRTPPKDLWWRKGFIGLDLLPRVELDNHEYPPRRQKRVLWLNGARKPGDHLFADAVRVHHTVAARARAGDGLYRPERILRRTGRSLATPAIVSSVEDLGVRWED